MQNAQRWLKWLWLLVPLVGVLELVAHYHFASAAPAPDEWETLREPVEAWHQPGDLVVVAPYWAEPNARAVFGDGKMPLDDVARPDESAYERAIELSVFGAETELQGFELLETKQYGPFELRLWKNEQHRPVKFDFVDALEPGKAEAFTVRPPGRNKERPCEWNPKAKVQTGTPALHGHPTFPRQRFECSRSAWHFVGVTVIEDERYRPHRCIWAHPKSRRATVVRFKDVPLQDGITGFGGISYFVERERKGTPVELEVRVGKDVVGNYTHEKGAGWTSFEFPTASYSGQRHDVEFRVTSKRSSQREFCFYAAVR